MNSKLWKLSHKLYAHGYRRVGRTLELIYNVLNANSISTEAEIGCNTVFFHHGLGCVVHRDCIIGDNCKIFGNVTIGCKWSNGVNDGKPPHIGDNYRSEHNSNNRCARELYCDWKSGKN